MSLVCSVVIKGECASRLEALHWKRTPLKNKCNASPFPRDNVNYDVLTSAN